MRTEDTSGALFRDLTVMSDNQRHLGIGGTCIYPVHSLVLSLYQLIVILRTASKNSLKGSSARFMLPRTGSCVWMALLCVQGAGDTPGFPFSD
jgi:hypothetical protein